MEKYQNFISAQNFPEDSKNTRIRILYPKNATSYHLAMEVPPRGAKIHYSYAEAFSFCMTKWLFPASESKVYEGKWNLPPWENGPHSSDEGNPYIKINLRARCLRKISKKRGTQIAS